MPAHESNTALEERLYDRTLHYLARYAASRAHLRKITLRRIQRDPELWGSLTKDDLSELVDRIVARAMREGWLDDRKYAEARARRLTQLGHPVARIRGAFLAQGLAKADIEAALSGLAEELGNADVAAAAAYARRRRLGPWRPEHERGAWRERDMMRLARAGFNYSLARTIVDAVSADALIEQLIPSPGR